MILAEAFGGVRSDTRKNGTPPMNDKEVLTEAEELRRQSSLLSTFEEIAQTSLSLVSGERGNGKVFTSLQDYLDGSVLINGAYCRRRTVLLAIHDLKDEREAPPALQSKTLSKLELLHLRPVPQVIFYDDIATAILRMEVVIRLEAMRKRLCDLLRRSAYLKKGLRSGAFTPFQVKRHDEAMTSDVENLMLEHLRAIRAGISEIKLKVDELPREPCRLAEDCRLSR